VFGTAAGFLAGQYFILSADKVTQNIGVTKGDLVDVLRTK